MITDYKRNFQIIAALSNNIAIKNLHFDRNADIYIQKILNAKNEKIVLNLYNKLSNCGKSVLDVDVDVLFAFIQSQMLPKTDMIHIAKNIGNILGLTLLTIPFKEENLCVLEYIIEMVDSIPLSIMEKYIDINKIQKEAIDLLFPSVWNEVVKSEKYYIFFEKTSNNNLIYELINKDILSQTALRLICANEELSNNIREMAFEQINDITFVRGGTEKVKEIIYNTCADTLFYPHQDEIPIEYIDLAKMYIEEATKYPFSLLSQKTEEDFVIRWGMNHNDTLNTYVENLINNTKYKSVFVTIIKSSSNVEISTKAIVKLDLLDVEKLFGATIQKIQNQIDEGTKIDDTDMWILAQLLSYDSKHIFLSDGDFLLNFIKTCNKSIINTHSLKPLATIVTDSYMNEIVIKTIKSKTIHNLIKDLATLTLTLKKTSLTKDEQFQITEAMRLLLFTEEDWQKYFNLNYITTPAGLLTIRDGLVEKPNAFCFKKVTKSDYRKIKKALQKLSVYSNDISKNKCFYGTEIIARALYYAMTAHKQNKHKRPEKKSNENIIEHFSDLYNQVMLCNNSVDFYNLTHKSGHMFIALFVEIKKRIGMRYIVKRMLPTHLQDLFIYE